IFCPQFSFSFNFIQHHQLAKLVITHSTPHFDFLESTDVCRRTTIFLVLFLRISPHPNLINISTCLHSHFIREYNPSPVFYCPIHKLSSKLQTLLLLLPCQVWSLSCN